MIKLFTEKDFNLKLVKIKTYKPFNEDILRSIDSLSKKILHSKEARKFSEIMSLGFWMRKSNIYNYKKRYGEDVTKFSNGLGMLFHIPPSNIETGFAYSLFFGLITGNTNVLRLPKNSKKIANFLISKINSLEKNQKKILKELIYLVSFERNDNFINDISNIADARLIWGSDETIDFFKNSKTKISCRDMFFSDKFSLCLLNSDDIVKLDKDEMNLLTKKFYNDTYLIDQNACSSPHLILWTGKNIKKAKKKFWYKMSMVIKQNYNLEHFAAVDKLNSAMIYSASKNEKIEIDNHKNYLIRINLKKLDNKIDKLKGKWGLFYEFNNKSKFIINLPFSKKYQTMTYFGYKKKEIEKMINNSKIHSLNRLVPVGSSLDMNLYWDGYDIVSTLTRKISFS